MQMIKNHMRKLGVIIKKRVLPILKAAIRDAIIYFLTQVLIAAVLSFFGIGII
jgi:ABC-type dipeptide/oligopeptide/nickel transport system permease subunit